MTLSAEPELLSPQTDGALALEIPESPAQVKRGSGLLRWLGGFFGLLWRWLAGAVLCMNYFTGILVAGWVYRWMQGRVLYNWWRQSRQAQAGSFRDYCDAQGLAAPVPRPRWFVRERVRAVLSQPGPDGAPAGFFRTALRVATIPWHSLWLNFKTGVTALFCTYLFTGWGCLLMLFGWEYGWLNSYHKGYELSAIGASVSLLGMVLFIAALYYVLMAQVHQAVVGERMAFFDFAFVWKLIQVKPTAYFFLILLLTLVSLPLEIMKAALLAPQTFGNNPDLSDAEVLQYLQLYTFVCCLVFFALLLWVRRVAAGIYSSAILKALARGRISRAELHPRLADWLDRLELWPVPTHSRHGLVKTARAGLGWLYRRKIYVLIFLVGFVFVGKRYVGEFLLYHPVMGFMNHELVQLPALDLITGTAASNAGD